MGNLTYYLDAVMRMKHYLQLMGETETAKEILKYPESGDAFENLRKFAFRRLAPDAEPSKDAEERLFDEFALYAVKEAVLFAPEAVGIGGTEKTIQVALVPAPGENGSTRTVKAMLGSQELGYLPAKITERHPLAKTFTMEAKAIDGHVYLELDTLQMDEAFRENRQLMGWKNEPCPQMEPTHFYQMPFQLYGGRAERENVKQMIEYMGQDELETLQGYIHTSHNTDRYYAGCPFGDELATGELKFRKNRTALGYFTVGAARELEPKELKLMESIQKGRYVDRDGELLESNILKFKPYSDFYEIDLQTGSIKLDFSEDDLAFAELAEEAGFAK